MNGAGADRLVDAWYRGAPWLWLLRPLELVYRGIIRFRRMAYRRGLRRRYRAPVPVVVVGNLTVGGAGKTPVVVALVEALQAAGLRPGVVSRGYGAGDGRFPHRVSERSTPRECGDEPLLIYRRTRCPVVVDPRRSVAVRELLRQAAPDIVLCDDGLQHYALARDLEIVVLDERRGLGNGFCLPAGPLREPRSRLASVDHVLYRGGSDPRSAVRYRPEALVSLADGRELPVAPGVLGRQVYAVAGIGQPDQFFDLLRAAGFEPLERPFPDHHDFSAADFASLQGRPVIMTEKDAVKCRETDHPDCWYLRITAELPDRVIDAVARLARGSQ